MEIRRRTLREYIDANGRNHFREWLDSLGDKHARFTIDARLTRIANGNFGDCERIGGGVKEFRINHGPGYRIYFGEEGWNVVILLLGGDKGSQKKDIKRAMDLWREYTGVEHNR